MFIYDSTRYECRGRRRRLSSHVVHRNFDEKKIKMYCTGCTIAKEGNMNKTIRGEGSKYWHS